MRTEELKVPRPTTSKTFILEAVKASRKAALRLWIVDDKKRRKTAISSDTPEKEALEIEKNIQNEKQKKTFDKLKSKQSKQCNLKQKPKVRNLVSVSWDEKPRNPQKGE